MDFSFLIEIQPRVPIPPWETNTVQDRHQITQNVLGEHKVITTEQQFLGVILSFFMHLRWPWLSRFFA